MKMEEKVLLCEVSDSGLLENETLMRIWKAKCVGTDADWDALPFDRTSRLMTRERLVLLLKCCIDNCYVGMLG